jgi:hypothetical protein
MAHLPEIVDGRASGDRDLASLYRGYLTSSIGYDLGRDELRGLEAFYAMLAEDGLLSGTPPPLIFHPTEACRPRTSDS